jgi:hypothetical protein
MESQTNMCIPCALMKYFGKNEQKCIFQIILIVQVTSHHIIKQHNLAVEIHRAHGSNITLAHHSPKEHFWEM